PAAARGAPRRPDAHPGQGPRHEEPDQGPARRGADPVALRLCPAPRRGEYAGKGRRLRQENQGTGDAGQGVSQPIVVRASRLLRCSRDGCTTTSGRSRCQNSKRTRSSPSSKSNSASASNPRSSTPSIRSLLSTPGLSLKSVASCATTRNSASKC